MGATLAAPPPGRQSGNDYVSGTESENARDAPVPPALNVCPGTSWGGVRAAAPVTRFGFDVLAPPQGAATIWPGVSPLIVARIGRPATLDPMFTTTVLPVVEATVTPVLPAPRVPVASTR